MRHFFGNFSQIQPEFRLMIPAPSATDPIPEPLQSLALFARMYDPRKYDPWMVVNTLRERYREMHRTIPLPESVKGKYPKPLENILAQYYGYASGDPSRSILAFWYHAHGYAPNSGPLPKFYLYPSPAFGYFPTPRERQAGKKRLYMWIAPGKKKARSITASSAEYWKERGEGKLFILFAYSADHARKMIERGEVLPYGVEPSPPVKRPPEIPEAAIPYMFTHEAIQERLKPVLRYYAMDVIPQRIGHEFSRSLIARITQDAYKAAGIPNLPEDKMLWGQRQIIPYVDALIRYLKTLHTRLSREHEQITRREPVQMTFFGLGARPIPRAPELEPVSRAQLEKMERRRHVPTGTIYYVNWYTVVPAVEWYGAKYSQRRLVNMLPTYRETGEPLMYKTIAQIKADSVPETPEAQTRFFGDLSGRLFHCLTWEQEPFLGFWRCRGYATACQARDICVTDPKARLRKCIRTKKVPSVFYKKDIERCAAYAPVCGACITSPAPKPEPLIKEPDPKEIRAVAEWMAEEAAAELPGYDPKLLAHEILSRGGIRAYRGRHEMEEYKAIPLFLKKREGLPPDEMASEMGFKSDVELYEAIHEAYPPRTARTPLQRKIEQRKPHWRDYEAGAYNYLITERRREAGLEGKV